MLDILIRRWEYPVDNSVNKFGDYSHYVDVIIRDRELPENKKRLCFLEGKHKRHVDDGARLSIFETIALSGAKCATSGLTINLEDLNE